MTRQELKPLTRASNERTGSKAMMKQVVLSMREHQGLALGRRQELLNARTVCVVYILVLTTHGVQVFPNQVYRLKTNLRLPP